MGRAHEVRAKKMAATNAAKSALYNRASKEIYLAAKSGVPDPQSNLSLRAAIEKFKGQGVTRDVIDRAIQKAKGGDSTTYVSGRYEGFGPGSVAIIVDTLADNDKRAFANVRAVFTHKGGHIGNTGSVMFLFKECGVFKFEFCKPAVMDEKKKKVIEEAQAYSPEEISAKKDEIEMALMDANIDETTTYNDADWTVEVTVDKKDFSAAHDVLNKLGYTEFLKSEICWVPNEKKHVEGEDRQKLINFVNALNEIEDVQNVYTDADFDPNNEPAD